MRDSHYVERRVEVNPPMSDKLRRATDHLGRGTFAPEKTAASIQQALPVRGSLARAFG